MTDLRSDFLEQAQSHLGTRVRTGTLSPYGQRVGYSGHDLPWSGSFIDCVARDSGLVLPALVQTASGLAEFIRARRLTEKPRPGDIVFYAWSTVPGFGMPHVGIVLETDRYKINGTFTAIEAQVNSGLPRSSKELDGVFVRTRVRNEVLAFARPNFKFRPGPDSKIETAAKISIRNIRRDRRHPDIELLQKALEMRVNLKFHAPGKFDAHTRHALSRWMRSIGFVGDDSTGEPELNSLIRLGRETGLFQVTTE
jgi:hypothetical protein